MALINCSECGKQVSDKAAACPHCGAPLAGGAPSQQPAAPATTPAKKNPNHIGCLPTTIVIIVVLWVLVKCSEGGSSSTSRPPASKPAAASNAQSDAQCRKSLQCWGDRHSIAATSACRVAIEREAKYQAEWTDSWAEVKFPRFSWADESKGTLRYLGDKVKFQNGFGAWQNMIYTCEYDPASRRVLRVLVIPRG